MENVSLFEVLYDGKMNMFAAYNDLQISGKVVAALAHDLLAVFDGFFGTARYAGHAVHAVTPPARAAVRHLDVVQRTDLCAPAAGHALVTGIEALRVDTAMKEAHADDADDPSQQGRAGFFRIELPAAMCRWQKNKELYYNSN